MLDKDFEGLDKAYARGYQAGYNDVIQLEIENSQKYYKRYVLESNK